jgi:hypothetical protein
VLGEVLPDRVAWPGCRYPSGHRLVKIPMAEPLLLISGEGGQTRRWLGHQNFKKYAASRL